MAGNNLTVADVREWLRLVDELDLDDSTVLNMSTLRVIVKTTNIEPLSCGDCEPQIAHAGHSLWLKECSKKD